MSSNRPEHHSEALDALAQAAEAAELYKHIEALAASLCQGIGIKDADTVIVATQELARRRARRQLSTVVSSTGLVEYIQAKLGEEHAPK